MRSGSIGCDGKTVTFTRGNKHRPKIPVWFQTYSTPAKAKRALSVWKRHTRFMQERHG